MWGCWLDSCGEEWGLLDGPLDTVMNTYVPQNADIIWRVRRAFIWIVRRLFIWIVRRLFIWIVRRLFIWIVRGYLFG